jgi:hypothetical protein
MMRKIFAMAIALLAIGMTVAPLVQAQDYAAMQRELLQVQQDVQAGRITEAQAAIRMNEINQKYLGGAGTVGGMPQGSTSGSDAGQAQNWQIRDQATQQSAQALQQQQQEPQQDSFPVGARTGWPSAAEFRRFNLLNLRQPAGTTVSYDIDNKEGISIYIRNGTQATFDQLAREIESGTSGREGYKDLTLYSHSLPWPSVLGQQSRDTSYYVRVELRNGGVILSTQVSIQ